MVLWGLFKPRLLRKIFASAVYAYRELLLIKEKLIYKCLDVSEFEKLAMNCSLCFGPPASRVTPVEHGSVGENRNDAEREGERSIRLYPDEPDYMVCFDGNFQHRRHAAASREFDEIPIRYPGIFLEPSYVESWAPSDANRQIVDVPLVCALIAFVHLDNP